MKCFFLSEFVYLIFSMNILVRRVEKRKRIENFSTDLYNQIHSKFINNQILDITFSLDLKYYIKFLNNNYYILYCMIYRKNFIYIIYTFFSLFSLSQQLLSESVSVILSIRCIGNFPSIYHHLSNVYIHGFNVFTVYVFIFFLHF